MIRFSGCHSFAVTHHMTLPGPAVPSPETHTESWEWRENTACGREGDASVSPCPSQELLVHVPPGRNQDGGDSRGAHAAFEVSEGFLWRQEVVVLVFEVIQLQVARSVHPEQLVS